MMRQLSLVLGLIGAVALATGACTSSGGNNNGQHDGGQQDASHQLDGAQQDDGGHQNDGGTTCTTTGYTSVSQAADYDSYYGDAFYYEGYDTATDPTDYLSIELYFTLGDPSPTMGPGTYTIGATAAEQDYATCGTCVLIYGSCSDRTDYTTCTKYYFATGGTLDITTFDNTNGFAGTLTNARLVEVTFDSSTGAMSKVAGGAVWCIASYTINSDITTPLPCTSNTDCAGLTDTPYCDTSSGACVQCLTEGNCSSLTATPHCDTSSGSCVECVTNTHCASNANGHICSYGVCGQCATSFDCTTPALPVCQTDTNGLLICGVGGTCTGDDAGDPNDDGPAGARTLTIGAAMSGNICKADNEYDFYKFTTSATGNITITVAWTAAGTDLDIDLYDDTGTEVDYAYTTSTTSPEVLAVTAQPAGTYYAAVSAYSPATTVAYTITVTTP